MPLRKQNKETDPTQHARLQEAADEESVPLSVAEQHPAAVGEPAIEVSQRSADGSDGTALLKTFVIAGSVDESHPLHEDNKIRVLDEAIQRGLHPKGKAKLINVEVVEETRRGAVSTECTYSVQVEPAITDHEAHKTVTPSSEIRERDRSEF